MASTAEGLTALLRISTSAPLAPWTSRARAPSAGRSLRWEYRQQRHLQLQQHHRPGAQRHHQRRGCTDKRQYQHPDPHRVNTYSGNTTISAGTLQIGGAGKLQTGATGFYSGDIAIASGATFQYSSSASNTAARYNGTISGDGTLIKDGSTSILRLQGTTSVANIEINQGTLRVQGNADASRGSGHNGHHRCQRKRECHLKLFRQ